MGEASKTQWKQFKKTRYSRCGLDVLIAAARDFAKAHDDARFVARRELRCTSVTRHRE